LCGNQLLVATTKLVDMTSEADELIYTNFSVKVGDIGCGRRLERCNFWHILC